MQSVSNACRSRGAGYGSHRFSGLSVKSTGLVLGRFRVPLCVFLQHAIAGYGVVPHSVFLHRLLALGGDIDLAFLQRAITPTRRELWSRVSTARLLLFVLHVVVFLIARSRAFPESFREPTLHTGGQLIPVF